MKHILQFILAGLLLAGLEVLYIERGRVVALQQENQLLREDLAAARRLISASESGASARTNEELERLRTEAREVRQLRNEISHLRSGVKELDQLRIENEQLRAATRQSSAAAKTGAAIPAAAPLQEGYYAKESWAFSGYATPEAALQSVIWAMREGDTKTFLSSLAPEEMARVQREWGNKSEAEISDDAKRGTDKISSIRILESKTVSDDEVVLNVYAAGGEDKVEKISMKRFGAEWKVAGPKKD